MKKIQFIPLVFAMIFFSCSRTEVPQSPSIIPAPVSLTLLKGHYVSGEDSRIRTKIVPPDKQAHPGQYRLVINRRSISITASDSLGIFYGKQSLRQLGPFDMDGNYINDSAGQPVQAVEIRDFPRFSWRGLMLDCSRTFLPVTYLKKTIDRMAMYKLNVLHLHLTDDQGWRVEILKYPELTSVCSRFSKDYPNEISGFYTQKELKDLVAYAAARFITIVPEIEMPGHSSEIFAAFPQYSCTHKTTSIFPFFSGPNITEDILCAGNDSVFVFLQDILDEVMAIFPSPYIHIGGDEAPKTRWKECPSCQARIREEKLRDESELQSYFIRRITEYVHSKGRRVIGWDEILEGGLAEGAAVMSWRGTDGGITAANLGHPVVMSPTSHCYFDYTYATIPVEKVYGFDPVPQGLDSAKRSLILGGQANLWTHIDRTEPLMDKQLYPRLIAMSEALWSPEGNKSFSDFQIRLKREFPRLERLNIPFVSPDPTR